MNPEQIQKVGRWPVRRMAGQGGFSWVFEVEDPNLFNVRRALKMLKPQAAEGEGLMRFMREVEILSPLDDAHLVRIYEHGTDAETGNRYYVMEWLTGSTLADVLRSAGPLQEARAIEVFDGVLRGLERIHALHPPVIHRDIKPPNIQITDDGLVKLIDFGIARKVVDGSVTVVDDSNLTVQNVFIGTVKYASPEQLRVKTLGPASDVFSLGLCLYEALEGRHPYADMPELPTQSYQDVFGYYVQLDAGRGSLSLKFKNTPRALQPVIKRAVAVKLGDRFRDAKEMRAALAQAATGKPGPPPRPREVAQPGVRASRSRAPLFAGAALLLIGAGVAGTWWWIGQGEGPRPVIVPNPPDAEPRPELVLIGPTAEQEGNRREARDLVARFDDRAEAIADVDATTFRESLASADAIWDEKRFEDADRAYRSASSVGKQILAGATPPPAPKTSPPDLDPGALALELAVGETREIAPRASDPDGTPTTLSYAVLHPGGGRSNASGPRFVFNPKLAGQYKIEVTATDEAGEKTVQLIAANVTPKPSGPDLPPTLTGVPKTFQLTVNETKEIAPQAKDPEGTPTTLSYVVQHPGGGRSAASGSRYTFQPRAPGEYTIEVTATDATRQKTVVRIAARVSDKQPVAAAQRPPSLNSVKPAGPLSLRVGDEQLIAAAGSDPDGDAVQIQFTVVQEGATPRRAVGSPFVFKPTSPGEYAIHVVAIDATGAESARKEVVRATVKSPAPPPPAPTPSPPAPTSLAGVPPDLAKFLDDYVNAWQDRDFDRLSALWRMDASDRALVQSAVESNTVIEARADLLELPKVKPGGGFADIRFTLEVTGFRGSETEEVLKGRYSAKLVKDSVGWRILLMHRE